MPPKRRASSPDVRATTARKVRRKASQNSQTNGVVDEDDEEEMELENDENLDINQMAPLTGPGGAGGDEDDDDDPDLSQNFDVPTTSEVGIIEKITLRNFMNHAMFEVRFGPRVNFIIGRNGSGKSAALTAIVIGLGGKANATNRGTSVKGFIKSGQQSADIKVRLRNRGQDAYKHELYGDSIIVERKLNRDGTGQYRLKDSNGKVVSTKREELTHILDAFNIQVDNPVSILNQDCSRNFLHSKNAQDKYKFFLKATQLEQLKSDYVIATEAKEVAHYNLQTKKETLPSLEREVLELEEQYKASQAMGDLKDRVKLLESEQAWAVISREEKKVEKAAKDIRSEESRTPKFIEKVEQKGSELAKLMESKKALDVRIQDYSKEASTMEDEHKDAKKAMMESKKTLRDATLEQRKVFNELKNLKQDHETITSKIEEIKNSAQEDYEKERILKEERITELESKIVELRAIQARREEEEQQYHAAVTRYKEDEYRIRAEEQDVRQNADQLQHQLRGLEAARGNRIKRFGQWMPEVLAMIDDYHKKGMFHQKPRGPLGAGLTVKKQVWAVAVESCLKSLIHAFAVHDHHDERRLEEIFNKKCPRGFRPAIITSHFQPQIYDVSRGRAQTNDYPTVLDMINCKDPVVANTLIDQRAIETILLIADPEETRDIMINRPPTNVREAFTQTGDQAYCLPTFRYYSMGKAKASILTASIEDNIKYCREQLEQKRIQHENVKTQQQEIKHAISTNLQEERKCQTQINKQGRQVAGLTLELTELKEKEDPKPIDITTLEEEAERINALMMEVGERKAVKDEALSAKQAESKDMEAAYRALDSRLVQLAESVDPYREEQAKLDNSISDAKEHKKHYEKKKNEHNAKITQLKEGHLAQVDKLDNDKKKAKEVFGERVESRQQRSPDNIQCEITQIQKQITKQEKMRGNHEEVTRRYHEKQEAYKKILQEVNGLNRFLSKLDEVMLHRQQQYFEFRKMIALRAKYFFIVTLNQRSYTGKISFNHQKESLTLSVAPASRSGEGSKDMKSLSGGERSFATVCFILSLWDCMESPFRCLDEFDVFMDLVNRRIATEMMLNVASQQTGRQFIFLTPLEISQMREDHNCSVFRMPDPSRGQQILPFGQEEEEQQEGEEARNK